MGSVASYSQESLTFIKGAEQEALRYFANKAPSRSSYSGNNYFSFNSYYIDTGSPSAYLSSEQKQEQDLQSAKIIGIVLLFLGVLAADLAITPFQKLTSLLAEDKKHIFLSSTQDNRLYRSIALDSQDIHSLQASRIYKHAVAAFLLIAGSVALATAGFMAAPLLLPTGYALITASLALACFTEVWHAYDGAFFDTRYRNILQTTCLIP